MEDVKRGKALMGLDSFVDEVMSHINPDSVGMVLVHRGIVRGTSKDGRKVKALRVSFDEKEISRIEEEFLKRDGIEAVRIRVRSGKLGVGDEIMTVVVAGRYRSDVIPALEELLARVKDAITEEEYYF